MKIQSQKTDLTTRFWKWKFVGNSVAHKCSENVYFKPGQLLFSTPSDAEGLVMQGERTDYNLCTYWAVVPHRSSSGNQILRVYFVQAGVWVFRDFYSNSSQTWPLAMLGDLNWDWFCGKYLTHTVYPTSKYLFLVDIECCMKIGHYLDSVAPATIIMKNIRKIGSKSQNVHLVET